MLSLSAQKRTERKKKLQALRAKGLIPAVLYGPNAKEEILSVAQKDFEKVFQEAGESALVSLTVDQKTAPVFIYDIQKDPLTSKVTHIDFYQPALDQKIELEVPLIFEGSAPAVKDLGGTLIKNMQKLEVRALPQDLPHEIRVDVSKLLTFEDRICVKDIGTDQKIEILNNPEDAIAQVLESQKVEEELAKPVEENVEEVGKVEKPKKEEEIAEGEEQPAEQKPGAPKA
ncbi:MAG: 50S ribosomal protein L25 [Candidatus Wildermuthbacteria bacterium]|nr:50S ribosomal protein L25 [Candidatus Wildermuthbacteria bacterium]